MARQINLFLTLSLLTLVQTLVSCQRESRRISGNNPYKDFKSPCGTADQLAHRLGDCMKEIFELIEGKFVEPKTDEDRLRYCSRFSNGERCARTLTKDCLSGIHKTSVSSVASATKRWRTRECRSAESRARYVEPLKCALKKGQEMTRVFQNHTGIMQGVRDLPITPEEKLMRMCCVLSSLDKELEWRYNKECPESMPMIVDIIHAMTDDARSTLCINPKCNHALDKVTGSKYTPPDYLIVPVAQILFQMNV